MDGSAVCSVHPDDVIDEARYLNDLEYRRAVNDDLAIEGDEPVDLSSVTGEDDLVFESTEGLGRFLDELLEEVTRELATANRTDAARATHQT